jgi:ABC-type lipoprotein release transport system permease subunit
VLQLDSRRRLEASLRAEPLARGSLLVLLAAAAAALALALVGLLLGLVADMRDESGELFDLESQGAGPPALRRHLRLRALAVAEFGLLGGIVTGAVLSALVVDLIVLTANAAAPEPPLRLAVDWPVVLLALLVYTVLSVGLLAVATSLAFRARSAGRLSEATA